jgi:regulator of replication initiation timing
MTDRELVVFLQQQVSDLTATLKSLTQEVAELKAALLEKDKAAEKLKRLADVNLSKKTEKRTKPSPVAEDKPKAPTPKERGK